MTIGKAIFYSDKIYIIVNEGGTIEKHNPIKWYARLWLEILQGLFKYKSVQELRAYLIKYSIKTREINNDKK